MYRATIVGILALLLPALTSAQAPCQQGPGCGTTQPVSCPNLTRTIALGFRGSDVNELQKYLVSKGLLTAAATGYFGSLTEAAVKKYQMQSGLVSSGAPATTGWGAVGPRTRATIAKECTASATVPAPTPPTPPAQTSALPEAPSAPTPPAAVPTTKANGIECSTASECTSGACIGGPTGIRYCASAGSICARPEGDGVASGESYIYRGDSFACYAAGLVRYLGTQDIPNGVVCKSSGQCKYGRCYAGPGNQSFCVDRYRACARPGEDGVDNAARYEYKGATYTCDANSGLSGPDVTKVSLDETAQLASALTALEEMLKGLNSWLGR